MPIAVPHAQDFLDCVAREYEIAPPKATRRIPREGKKCRRRRRALPLGRSGVTRDALAHQLAHYLHWKIAKAGRGQPVHGAEFDRWLRVAETYVAESFGPGDGVIQAVIHFPKKKQGGVKWRRMLTRCSA